jgi:hypothetical protein
MSRVIIASSLKKTSRVILNKKNGECKFEEKKTTSVILKKKNDECNGKKKTASVYSHGPSRPSYTMASFQF